MASDHVNAVLPEVEVSTRETPAQLRARADALMEEYRAAVAAPMRLSAEMAQFRARAGAIERRDAARVPVAQAEDALAAVEDAFAATAQPEEEAATRSTRARHLFEKARGELLQTRENGAEPADLVELDLRAESSARVDEHELAALAAAQGTRELARRALDAARAALAGAREDLAAVEAQVENPLTGDRPLGERLGYLIYTWPLRVALKGTPGHELDAIDLALCRALCEETAQVLDVVPPRLAQGIRDEAAREATRDSGGPPSAFPGVE